MKRLVLPIILILLLTFALTGMTTAWDVSTASYANKSHVVSEDSVPCGVTFNSDGTKMYVAGAANDAVFQYTLSPGWDVSTASYASKSCDVSNEDADPYDVDFSSDGSKMYIAGAANDTIFQYTVGTPWDVSTASYASKSFVVTEDTHPYGIIFNSDGTKMYVMGNTADIIFQYTLGTGWDVSTASYASKSIDITTEDAAPFDMSFNSDGTIMYAVGNANDTVFQYTLGTGWDVSTANYASKSFVVSEDTETYGIAFSSDGAKMYIMGLANDTVFQYTLVAVGITWNGTTITKLNGIAITIPPNTQ